MPTETATEPTASEAAAKSWSTLQAKLADFKTREATLDVKGYQEYVDALTEANKGQGDFENVQMAAKDRYKKDILSRLKKIDIGYHDPAFVENLADQAAQRFIVERKTGEIGVVDFILKTGGIDEGFRPAVQNALSDISTPRVGGYIPYQSGDFNPELSRVNPLFAQAKQSQEAKDVAARQSELAAGQREESANLFSQATDELKKPLPLFTPQYSEGALEHILEAIGVQGVRAKSDNAAAAGARGISGSSIEAFGQAETEGNIANAISSAVFNFLQASGAAGQQNKNAIATALLGHANALLGAGQQTEGLATNTMFAGSERDLASKQLAHQIAAFNQTFTESQRQFNANLDFQKTTASENIALLLQKLMQPKSKNFTSTGTLLGAGLGAAFAIPTGGLSLAAGAGIGAGLGGGLGAAFSD